MTSAEPVESPDMPVGEVPVEKDVLRIYGFSFEFPKTRKLEFNPKFKRTDGDVAVKSPEKAVVFVSWGELEKVVKKAPTIEDHAKYSLERVKKSVQGKMKDVQQKKLTVNGHEAMYSTARIEVPKRGLFGKPNYNDVTSVHLHCPETGRYYVIYSTSGQDILAEQNGVLDGIVATFRCH